MRNSYLGYKRYSPDRNQKSLVIPGRHITMKDVDIPLRLIPVVKGRPNHKKSVIAYPGDDDVIFDDDVDSVIEMPMHQIGNMVGENEAEKAFNSHGYDYGVANEPIYNMMMGLPVTLGEANSYEIMDNYKGESGYTPKSYLTVPTYNFPNTEPKKSFPQTYAPDNSHHLKSDTLQRYTDPTTGRILESSEMLSNDLKKAKEMPQATVNNWQDMQKVTKEAQEQNTTQQNSETNKDIKESPIEGFNPYSGWNMYTSAQAAGKYISEGRALPAIAAIGKFAFEGIRNYMQGSANAAREREAREDYAKKLAKDQSPNNIKKWRFMKDGGLHFMKGGGRVGRLLTGNYIDGGNGDGRHANAELEAGEYFKTPQNETYEVMGKKHSEGGEKLNLEQGTKVVSDYLKIGSKLATYFKKHFDLNVAPSNTFATVVDKFKKKIGLTKVLEEEGAIMKKIYDQEQISHVGTRDLNLQVLSEKVHKLQPQKEKLEDMLNNFMDVVFDRQEEVKDLETDGYKKQEGGMQGEVSEMPVEGQPMDGQQGMNDEQLVQLVTMYAEIIGQDPNALLQHIQSLPENELQMAVQKMVETIQQAQSQQQGGVPQGEGQPQSTLPMEEGDIRMLFQAFAEKAGKSVEEVAQIFNEIPENEKAKVLEDMKAYVMSEDGQSIGTPVNESQMQGQVNPQQVAQPEMQYGGMSGDDDRVMQTIQAYSEMSGSDVNEVISKLQELSEDELAETLQKMTEYVESNNGGQQGFYKEGGRLEIKKYKNAGAVDNRTYITPEDFLELMSKGEYVPNYKYGDLEAYKARMNDIRSGLNMAMGDYKTQADYDGGAGEFQNEYLNKYGEVAKHYSQRIDSTQQGLQYLLDNGIVDANELRKYGLKTYKGKVAIGTLGGLSAEGKKYVADAVAKMYQDTTEKGKSIAKGYTDKNFFDNKFYFRAPKIHNVGFEDEAKRDEWLKKQGYELVSDKDGKKIYYSNVRGEYLQTHIGKVNNGELITNNNSGNGSSTESNPDATQGIEPLKTKDISYSSAPARLPVPTDFYPTLHTPSLRHIGHVQADHFAVSPEASIRDISANNMTVRDAMMQANPYTAAFGQSDLFAKTVKGIGDVYAKTEAMNQQDKRNVDNLNEQRILARDAANINATNGYEHLAQMAIQGFQQEQQDAKDRHDLIQYNNYNTANQIAASNAINPFFQITAGGWRNPNNPHQFTLRQMGMFEDEDSKAKTTTTKTSTSNDGTKTKTTTTKGRRGGAWGRKGFLR